VKAVDVEERPRPARSAGKDERLPRQIHRQLKEIGWTKAADLAKLARRQGEQ